MTDEYDNAIRALLNPKPNEDRWPPGVIQMKVYAELESALWGIACLALKNDWNKKITYEFVTDWITDDELLDQFADDLEYEN